MIYTVRTRCPSCGTITSHRVFDYELYDQNEHTICPMCGFRYTNANHCVERIQEEEEKTKKTSPRKSSSHLCTNELEDKLNWSKH